MIKPVNTQKAPLEYIAYQGFTLGLNTSVPPSMISPQELSKCVDFKIKRGGKLESRSALVKYTTTATTGEVVAATSAMISGTSRDIVGDDDSKVYYILTSGDTVVPTLIGTVEGAPSFVLYNNVCLVIDGSYLKYIDSVSGIKIAYDAGDDGVQFDNIAGDQDEEIKLDGSVIRVGTKFTTQTWTAGYTIPPTEAHAALKRTGTVTGDIYFKIRAVADDAVMASKLINQDAGDIATAGEVVEVVFTSSDVTTELSPNTDYYFTVEYAGVDSSNYISLMCTTEAGLAQSYVSAYTEDTTAKPVMKVYPGKPPKASMACVSGTRLFVVDPDEPGRVRFGNLTHLDWSTYNGGGWIGVVDDQKNSFKIGGIADMYGQLYVFGTQEIPYLCRLEGSSPSNYSLPLMFQRAWTTQKCIVNTANDIWFGSSDGIDTLSGVQEYGDVRSFSASDPVKNKLSDWSTASFAGYYPPDGTFLIYMGDKVLCANTKAPVSSPDGTRFPWFEYDLPITTTCFGHISTGVVFGADDGFLYRFDDSEYKDLSTIQILPEWKSSYLQVPMTSAIIEKIHLVANSVTGGIVELKMYLNSQLYNATNTFDFTIQWEDNLVIEEALMQIDDANFAISASANPFWQIANMKCRSFMVGAKVTSLFGLPISFDGVIVEYRKLQQWQ